jgi:hypothetical protein
MMGEMIMKVKICSRMTASSLIKNNFPKNVSVISFYTPVKENSGFGSRVDYAGVCDHVFYIGVPDISEEEFDEYGFADEPFIAEADELADFILKANAEGRDIICQCDFGMSRSAACAAAILEYFEGRGSEIFLNDNYCPNLAVFDKVFSALFKKRNS